MRSSIVQFSLGKNQIVRVRIFSDLFSVIVVRVSIMIIRIAVVSGIIIVGIRLWVGVRGSIRGSIGSGSGHGAAGGFIFGGSLANDMIVRIPVVISIRIISVVPIVPGFGFGLTIGLGESLGGGHGHGQKSREHN